ncbi:hypothetical protein ACOMHN_008308 [Nucella lapillus]
MAGPEDSPTSTHHHGNPPDPSDLRLVQDNSDDHSFMDEKRATTPTESHTDSDILTPTDPPTSLKESHTIESDTTTFVDPGARFKIDLRGAGKEKKKTSDQTPACQTAYSKTSQVCQLDDETSDVFDVSDHHPHRLFFFEDDENDDDNNDDSSNEKEENSENDDSDAFENNDINETEYERSLCNTNQDFEPETQIPAQIPGHHFEENREDLLKSASWNIPGVHSSSLSTVCRRGSHSQMVVRCQIQSTCNTNIRHASSCPAAFSSAWVTRGVTAPPVRRLDTRGPEATAGDELQRSGGRKRLKPDSQSSPPRQRQGQGQAPGYDPESLQDDLCSQVTFKCRSRSYSDSDVQRLLIKEVSTELRRIGDEFQRLRGHRVTPVITELIMEEGHANEM